MDQKNIVVKEDEVSLKDIIKTFKEYFRFIFSKWWVITVVAIIGGSIGYLYSYKQVPVYTSVCTFILEGGGGPSVSGGIQGLPQLFGAQQGAKNSGGGLMSLFQTNNYNALYKSRRIMEQTMVSEATFGSEKMLLIDYYIDMKKYRQGPDKAKYENVDFHIPKDKFSSKHNLIMNLVLSDIKKIYSIQSAEVGEPVLSVKVQTTDSLLSKIFSEKVLEVVNQFYIETKNYKAKENIDKLEKNADNLKNALFSQMSGVAISQQSIPNANTAYQTVKLPPQKKQIEVSFLQTLYTTTASELATARNEMRGLQPFIIILDKPTYPLPLTEPNIKYAIIIGAVASVILSILILILVLLVRKGMA